MIPERPAEPGKKYALALTFTVHAALIGALFLGVQWKRSQPEVYEVELWSSKPTPATYVPPPPPPEEKQPEPRPEPKPEPKPEPRPEPKVEPKKPDIVHKEEKKKPEEKKEKRAGKKAGTAEARTQKSGKGAGEQNPGQA